MENIHEKYMRYALELAKKGIGAVNPNPLVGAVIVKDNRIIGEGYHKKYGELHAERNALADCRNRGENPEGAVIYVTLEPCCHYGKTPPCTEAIIESGIKTVYIGSKDINPLVAGGGITVLKENGIKVIAGVLENECDSINEVFFHYIKTKLPFVVMKYAMTMDGKIATYTGASKWITGEEARYKVHEDRNRYSAIMTGVGTVIKDNPMLTCRIKNGNNPIRVICDTGLRTPLNANVVVTSKEIPTIIATCCKDKQKQQPYINAGCEVLTVREKSGDNANIVVDVADLIKKLGEKKIDSVLLEGGAAINWSALSAGIVNKVQTYIAPKIFGGETAKCPVGGSGVKAVSEAFGLEIESVSRIDEDILIESICRNND